MCGKGDISDDAYVTMADIHNEPAPSYSTTVVEIEDDISPPRYSVTAREILSALKANKNMRRPSWFHYGESESDDDDDVFVDALSQLGSENADEHQVEDEVFEESSFSSIKDVEAEEINTTSSTLKKSSTASSFSTVSLASTTERIPIKVTRRSVEFANVQYNMSDSSSNDDEPNVSSRRDAVPEHSWLRLVCPSLATVMILDDDHHGIFSLTERSVCLTETAGTYNINVMRCGGSRGRIALAYKTEEGTAKPGRDYQHCEGQLIFEEGDTE